MGRHSHETSSTQAQTGFDQGSHLDGNAAAGTLNELLTLDVTTARSRCENCGDEGHLAEAMLYSSEMGLVARCRRCEAVLLKLVENDRHVWLDLRGISYLQLDREPIDG